MKILRFGQQFAKLCFVFLISCLFALGPGSTVKASSIGFYVSGRFLLDANGNNFIMRGVNVPHNWYPAETSSSFQNIKAKGANTVRVVLSSGQSWEKNSASDVANVITLCKANQLVCVLEVHDTTGYVEDPADTSTASLAQAVSYWIEIKSALVGQEAYVIINIGNEPYGNSNTANWVNATKSAIAALRSAGFQHMLMVDGPDWGQDWEYIMRDNAASIFNSDPLRNTVFSIHMYEVFDTPNPINNYVSTFVNAGLPLVIGEFGPVNSGPGADVDTVMAAAQANGIGYLGWEWSGDADVDLDMVSNFDPSQETAWGNRIIHGLNGIASTSQSASIYGVTLKGNTGVAGVTLAYMDNGPKSVMSDGSGNYTINVPSGWTGTVTPKKIGYQFTPVNKSYSNVQSNQTAQNYTAAVCPTCADKDTVGVFRPGNGALYLRNLNVTGFADVAINYGLAGDYPVVGDWDGNGTDTIGIYRNGTFYLRNSNSLGFANITVAFGSPGDQPIAGDWNNDGVDTIGVYRSSTGTFLLRNTNTPGVPDVTFALGNAGDLGIAGDWNGDGIDTTGVFRPSNGVIFLKNKNESGFADIALNYGLPGDQPVVGDWDNNGTTTIGIYRNARFYLRNSNTNGFANIQLDLGNVGDMPIGGNWDALP